MRGARPWLAPAPRNKTASSRAWQTMGHEHLFVGPERASDPSKLPQHRND
jgi:hypothetical protein